MPPVTPGHLADILSGAHNCAVSRTQEGDRGPRPNTAQVPQAQCESWPDTNMATKDLTEVLTAVATLATLPELTPSQFGWLVVLVLLTRNRDGQPPTP